MLSHKKGIAFLALEPHKKRHCFFGNFWHIPALLNLKEEGEASIQELIHVGQQLCVELIVQLQPLFFVDDLLAVE